VTHPFSIHIWQPPQTPTGTGSWVEPLHASSEEFALYVANLIHNDSNAVIKVVRDEQTLASFPDEKTVAQVKQQKAP
jgi:hypothetical protein